MNIFSCRKCGKSKPQEEFPFRVDSGKYRTQCKVCYKEYQRNQFYIRTYGVTLEDVVDIYENQNRACKICCKEVDMTFNTRLAHLDHCHESGDIRGILCPQCNQGLGSFRDNEEFLKNAIKYLRGDL